MYNTVVLGTVVRIVVTHTRCIGHGVLDPVVCTLVIDIQPMLYWDV
jgi:hypothetical protein